MDNRLGIALSGTDARATDNQVAGGQTGIAILGAGSPSLIGNTVEGFSGRGISITGRASPSLSGNSVSCGEGTTLFVSDDATPEIDDTNEICEDVATK